MNLDCNDCCSEVDEGEEVVLCTDCGVVLCPVCPVLGGIMYRCEECDENWQIDGDDDE